MAVAHRPYPSSVVTPAKAGMTISKRPRAFLDLERLDHVADLDVVRVLKPDAAFQTGAHFVDVVLEAPQRGDRPGVDDDIVPHDARLEIAPDLAFPYQHASRLAMLSGLAHFAPFGPADDVFEQLGTKLARHRRQDFGDQIIDDVVIFQRQIGREAGRERVVLYV